jgi:hypothetical protein
MVNNEFHLIGIATSNFQQVGTGNFKSYLLRLELEKVGSKKGQTFELEVQVYGTNRSIDVNKYVLGFQVAINGYIDSFVNKDNILVTKVVAQNLMVLDKKTSFAEQEQSQEPTQEVDTSVWDELVKSSVEPEERNNSPVADLPDDDLPF